VKVFEHCKHCTGLRLIVCSRIPLPPKELLLMGAIIGEMVTFAVVNMDMVEAIGMDDSEFIIPLVGV